LLFKFHALCKQIIGAQIRTRTWRSRHACFCGCTRPSRKSVK
jgi:hypothetical protein